MIRVSLMESLPEIRRSMDRLLKKEPDIHYTGSFKGDSEFERSDLVEEIDLLILDIHLSADVSLHKLKKQNQDLMILIYTVFDHDPQLLESIKQGAHGYVLKSGNSRGLLDSIINLVEKRSDMSPGFARQLKKFLEISFESDPNVKKKWSPEKMAIINSISEGQSIGRVAKKMDRSDEYIQKKIFEIYSQLSG